MKSGYVTVWNGTFHSELTDSNLPIPGQLRFLLDKLDGAKNWSFALWSLPVGRTFNSIHLAQWPKEYLQSAGTATGMTIELRRMEADSAFHQYAVGRSSVGSNDDDVTITWPGNDPKAPNSLTIPGSEVFTAEQTAAVYLHYIEHGGTVPKDCHLRELPI